jgi:Domain of unknown function (DUF4258)
MHALVAGIHVLLAVSRGTKDVDGWDIGERGHAGLRTAMPSHDEWGICTMIRYDEHAEFQIARRNIEKAWIEAVLQSPDIVEKDLSRQSFFKCLPGRHVMLRVVTPLNDPDYVITAYFDRTRPCA